MLQTTRERKHIRYWQQVWSFSKTWPHFRRYLNKSYEKRWYTAMFIKAVHVFVVYFHNVRLRSIVDNIEVWMDPSKVLPDAMYGRHKCWEKHEVCFGQSKTNLFLQISYNFSVVVRYKTCKRSNTFLQSALLKSIFKHYFLYVGQHKVLAVICRLKDILEIVDAKFLWADDR